MILKEDYAPSLPSSAKEELDRQAAAASKMGALIDDLLRLSRLARQQMDLKAVDLTALANEIHVEATAGKDIPSLSFESEPNLSANVDVKLFRLALENLIGNAVKFSPNGGVIRFGKVAHQNGEAFYIRDEGIGFDQQYAEKMFLPFERLVLDREFPGTGIGLANVKRIVERHGGSVWAEGELGKGSTFFFTIP
jgi:signal transduction histidine kinase